MATRDHTVRIRSSVPPDDTLTPPPDEPSSTSLAWPATLRHSTRGDIALPSNQLAVGEEWQYPQDGKTIVITVVGGRVVSFETVHD